MRVLKYSSIIVALVLAGICPPLSAGEKTLEASRKRYPLLAKLVAAEEVEDL